MSWSYAPPVAGLVNTTAVQIAAAPADTVQRNYIDSIQIDATALTAASELVVRSGAAGTVLWRCNIGTAGLLGGRNIPFPQPLPGVPGQLLEIALLTNPIAGSVYLNAQGHTAP